MSQDVGLVLDVGFFSNSLREIVHFCCSSVNHNNDPFMSYTPFLIADVK